MNRGTSQVLRKGCGKCDKVDGQYVCHTPEDSVTCFWSNSINGTPEKFNFEENSRHFKGRLRSKLAEHGLRGKEEFVQIQEHIYGERTELSQWTQRTPYINISEDELREELDEHQWKRNKETFEDHPTFEELQKTFQKSKDIESKETSEQVTAFDSLIHAQHETGQVVEEVDIEELREDFEQRIN